MFDPNTLKNIQEMEEASRASNSLGGVPALELIDSAARLASTANQIDIKNIAAVEEAVRVQNSAAAQAAEMLAEHVRLQNPAVPGLTAVPSLSGLPISELVDSAARLAGMADQIGTKNIEAVIERTGRIAASIVETMPAMPSLTPANFGFVPGGRAERAWKGFSDRAAALAGGGAAAEEESVQALLEDAATVAAHTPAESKEKVESCVRLVLISVFANIIADPVIEGAKALWPLLITLLTCVPLPKPPPPMPKPPPPPPALMEEAPPSSPALLVPGGWRIEGLPGLIREAGLFAEQRLVEFFTGGNPQPQHTSGIRFCNGSFLSMV